MELQNTPCCALRFLYGVTNQDSKKEITGYLEEQVHNSKAYGNSFQEVICITTPGEKSLERILQKIGFVKMKPSLGRNLYASSYLTLWIWSVSPTKRAERKKGVKGNASKSAA